MHKETKMVLTSPLFTEWTEQYVRLYLADTQPGTPLALTVNGQASPFQYTGISTPKGAEILVKLGFEAGEKKQLIFANSAELSTHFARTPISLAKSASIGIPGRKLAIPEAKPTDSLLPAPFSSFADSAMKSSICCETAFEGASLYQTNDGPLFTDYELQYCFAENRCYTLNFRCYKDDSYIEVTETFSLGMNSEMVWTINPDKRFTHIISRDSFANETQPTIEPLGEEHPQDVLGRLQMPVLTEYFIPNNRGWFAFYDQRNESSGMLGILGLYGAKWENPVVSMPELFDRDGTVEWHASLASGKRHWMLYAGPVETEFRPATQSNLNEKDDSRFVFHRLHAEFNALRLDENLDLTGETLFDESCAHCPGILAAGDYHATAREREQKYAFLGKVLDEPDEWLKSNGGMHLASFAYLLEPTPEKADELFNHLILRFEKWVSQFQGYRLGEHDYMKSVIGFSRYLRGMLIAYEQLRRDDALSPEQVRVLNAYFSFAARRILDEGRWPHSRTWLHPDHPESSRNFYTYGGEHAPDRLVWTNSLPNFQSDPMCALAQLSSLFKDHPDSRFWLRFALDDIDRQLDAYCGKSGAWEESINYALYTFSYMIITFKTVKERWGINYFQDERVRRMVSWLCRFFGPYDKRFDAYTWPAIGNSVLPQNQGEYFLCYAAELADDDPLRADCLAVWKLCAEHCRPSEHYPVVMAAMAPEIDSDEEFPLPILHSETMDEVGVSMRDRHTQSDESYLFQKIGFAKDHYENDESAFNWYAKGTPFCMDYGTYTPDVGIGGAHNLVEIPDEDSLRRGYLADHLFTEALDYTRCEIPVVLKLLWGKVRTFAEVEAQNGKVKRENTPYFYIGDKNPVGPKVWKVRQLLFVKPDYTVLFDRVYGRVPHRYNLHMTGTNIQRNGATITADGRFDLDLLAYVQHPTEFEMETGELIPKLRSGSGDDGIRHKHSQHYFRLYNQVDGIYRTLIFAKERGREISVSTVGKHGIKVVTPEYTDYVFCYNDWIDEKTEEVTFSGRAGWIRRHNDGQVEAIVPDGDLINAFGEHLECRGPWAYKNGTLEGMTVCGGLPRTRVTTK